MVGFVNKNKKLNPAVFQKLAAARKPVGTAKPVGGMPKISGSKGSVAPMPKNVAGRVAGLGGKVMGSMMKKGGAVKKSKPRGKK
jgi:hypothetical protein